MKTVMEIKIEEEFLAGFKHDKFNNTIQYKIYLSEIQTVKH